MDEPVVLRERRGAISIISINRPHRKNAVTQAVSLEIAGAIDELDNDPTLLVGVITGAGGTFCAGMDLQAFVDGERPELPGRGFGGLTEAPPRKPLIAAVEGYALAGGFELALACDLVVAAETAVFGLPEVSRGLVAGSGGLTRLPQRVPKAIALELCLTGRRFTAIEALQFGLINRMTQPAGALAGALGLAEEITVNAPLSVIMSKRIIYESAEWRGPEMWERQRPLSESVIASNDALEGARAFAEKRPPEWRGN